MEGLVTIITPNYNTEKFIVECVESVIHQTYTNWELIIIDDCSTDNSVAIIKQLQANDQRIKLIELTKNSGPAIARNAGIKAAKGSYLTFIDSDDLWFPNFISTSLKHIHNSEGFVFSSYHRFDEFLKPKFKTFIVPNKVTYAAILKSNSISCLTAFINIDLLGKFLMPEVRYRQDMGLWLKYLKKINFAHGIKEPLAIYRIRAHSHSRNKLKLLSHQWNFYRNVANLSVLKSIYFILFWIFFGIKKYYV
jgi:teichuronic acid biosynthesis glycosyltransferase TuaG